MPSKRKFSAMSKSSDIVYKIPNIPMINNQWVSGSKTRNYTLNNPIVDWLNLYGTLKGYVPDNAAANYRPELDFGNYIMKQGIKYEEYIMKKLRTKFGSDLLEFKQNSNFTENIHNTICAMNSGTPIISQGMIFNPRDKTYGTPDLIVRSDYINKLVEYPAIKNENTGCALSSSWHYRIVDIKFSTLKLKADATHLLNTGSQKAYKVQMNIYNVSLAYIQQYDPKKSYILGRGWNFSKGNKTYTSDNPFSKLGIVDFETEPDIAEISNAAVEWIKLCRLHGDSWSLSPPSVPELYPNMKEANTGWDTVLNKLADDNKEISNIWQCTLDNREYAHSKSIYKWDDKKCCSKTLGISSKGTSRIVDSIITHNKLTTPLISPKEILTSIYNWRYQTGKEFFIDFENVSSIDNLEDNSFNMVYLFGVGYIDNDKWIFNSFIADKLTYGNESCAVKQFILHLDDKTKYSYTCPNCNTEHRHYSTDHIMCSSCFWNCCPLQGWWDGAAQCSCVDYMPPDDIILWHYSHAEKTMFTSAVDRIVYDDPLEEDKIKSIIKRIKFQDMYKLLISEPVVMTGSLNYSLKSIVGALNKAGKIRLSYEQCDITGVNSMLAAFVADKEHDTLADSSAVQEVIKYNELDCKSLHDILEYLRDAH